MNDQYPHVALLRYSVSSDENYRLADDVNFDGLVGDFSAKVNRLVAQFTPMRHFATEREACEALDPLLRAWEIDAAMTHAPGVIEFRFHSSTIRDAPRAPGQLEGVAAMIFGGSVRAHVTLSYVPPPPMEFAADSMVVSLAAFYMLSKKTPAVLLHMAYAMTTCVEHYLEDLSNAALVLGISQSVFKKLNALASTRGEGAQVRKFKGPAPTPLTHGEREWVAKILRLIVERAGHVAAGVTDLPEINMGTHPLS